MSTESLEWGCLNTSADRVGEMPSTGHLEMLSHDPYEPSEAQSYGSADCSGFVVEIMNTRGYDFVTTFIQGAGLVLDAGDNFVYGNSMLCSGMTLEADFYGYRNGFWDTLASIRENGRFVENDDEEGHGACDLTYEMEQVGTYELVRVAGRVSNEVATYPFRVVVN